MKSSLLLLVSSFLLFTAQAHASAPAPADSTTAEASKAPSLNGAWSGTLAIPGKTQKCGLRITETSGQVAAYLSIAGTQVERHRLTLTQRHDTLNFYDPLTEAHYECMRSTDGKLLVGQWQQRGFQNTLIFRQEDVAQPAQAALPNRRNLLAFSGR